MTHCERVLKALAHEEADRVPWDLWAAPEVMERLRAHLADRGTACRAPARRDDEAVLRHFDVDLRTIRGPSYAGQEMRTYPGGIVEDLWGVKRKLVTVEQGGYRWSYKHVVEHPLADARTVADIENYPGWPDPDAWDFSNVAAECRRYRNFAVVNRGDRLDRTAQLKPAMYLRGTEQILVDLATNPALAEAVFQHIHDYFMAYNRRVFEASMVPAKDPSPLQGEGRGEGGNSLTRKLTPSPLPSPPYGERGVMERREGRSEGRIPRSLIDIFMMGDDFGTQHGPIVSPDMWRRFFRKRFRESIDLAHSFGILVCHHTCGSVRALIGEFIDCGLDILQSIQPQAKGMDLAELKREFGARICFHGSIDIQGALPHGTPEDVRREVRTRMEAGKPGGGFIISTAHNILPDTPTQNILALFEAYREYGSY